MKVPVLLLIFVVGMSLLSYDVQSIRPNYEYHVCSDVTFPPDGEYQSNLKNLLHNLSSNATANMNGYFRLSVPIEDEDNPVQESPSSFTVYGSYLCRGDVTEDVCSDCVSYAVKDMVKLCPRIKEAYIWYDECSLRYSGSNIFDSDQDSLVISSYNKENVSNPNGLEQFIGTTMAGEMTSQAASDTSGKKFVTKEANLSSNETVYSLVQCTPDLAVANCIRCIQNGISVIPPATTAAMVLLPSCVVTYSLHPFYNLSYALAHPAPSPPPVAVTPSTAGTPNMGKKNSSAKVIVRIALLVTLVALFLAAVGMSFIVRTTRQGNCWKNKRHAAKKTLSVKDVEISRNAFTTAESLQYDLNLIQAATNNFSDANKLGEGGFGAVYRGKLPDGKEIAVKRLSQGSSQGVAEFKNEIVLVANLQHRNLVKLLGFCLAKMEKLLVYEFVPNMSLDYFFSDPEKQAKLDWTMRYKIIQGIARGILYLHEDSRLRIVHRDIKASNILLDADMTPKISDFGLAKIIAIDQSRGNTTRVSGTYGYMAPEYVTKGGFSKSSDVYSFGVLVLEIISGQKINKFQQSEYPEHLMSYAWKKWKENEALEIMEPSLRGGTYSTGEVIRCIHLALLCVQEDADARPSMSRVVLMLSRRFATLPPPRNPAFYVRTNTEMYSDTKSLPSSANSVTITVVGPR